ncbi:hypothetical protein E2562_015925 [Oryza meyeriana var. granulata]|uniref:Uncharacterized protein n=1 Tax=Oryza meyeriana var. granulata TaxID=110450 RepID=A0A6G1CGG6_9ORYZ|nr:hypothetical protein E2562_015925 [Oryza meyeriana var. granulata]
MVAAAGPLLPLGSGDKGSSPTCVRRQQPRPQQVTGATSQRWRGSSPAYRRRRRGPTDDDGSGALALLFGDGSSDRDPPWPADGGIVLLPDLWAVPAAVVLRKQRGLVRGDSRSSSWRVLAAMVQERRPPRHAAMG